jgi:hypothetical protein
LALNAATRCCSSLIWNNQTALVAPRLAAFKAKQKRQMKDKQALTVQPLTGYKLALPICSMPGKGIGSLII